MEKEYTDLTYLMEMASGVKEIVVETVEIFKQQVPEFTENFEKHYADQNWTALGLEAHKAKSSAKILGMNELADNLQWLETNAKLSIEIGKYAGIIEIFKHDAQAALVELDTKLAALD